MVTAGNMFEAHLFFDGQIKVHSFIKPYEKKMLIKCSSCCCWKNMDAESDISFLTFYGRRLLSSAKLNFEMIAAIFCMLM